MNPVLPESDPSPKPTPNLSAKEAIVIPVDGVELYAELLVPAGAKGLVLSVLASGCVRETPRARELAHVFANRGIATLTLPLLTRTEAEKDIHSAYWSFNLELLARRITTAARWALLDSRTRSLRLGFLGSGTFAAALLVVAAQLGCIVQAVVCRAGRPDFAGDWLQAVMAPTLLIVGERDELLAEINRRALERLGGGRELAVIAGAGHLFEEPGTFEGMAALATEWFDRLF